jgi:hypothetical protein
MCADHRITVFPQDSEQDCPDIGLRGQRPKRIQCPHANAIVRIVTQRRQEGVAYVRVAKPAAKKIERVHSHGGIRRSPGRTQKQGVHPLLVEFTGEFTGDRILKDNPNTPVAERLNLMDRGKVSGTMIQSSREEPNRHEDGASGETPRPRRKARRREPLPPSRSRLPYLIAQCGRQSLPARRQQFQRRLHPLSFHCPMECGQTRFGSAAFRTSVKMRFHCLLRLRRKFTV